MSVVATTVRAAAKYMLPKSAVPKDVSAVPRRLGKWREGTNSNTKVFINRMHKGLYPDLYDTNGAPVVDLEAPDEPPKTPRAVKREIQQRMAGRSWELPQQRKIIVYPNKLTIKKTCPDPVGTITAAQIALLDPTGARTRLFAKDNPECARVGDILLVRLRTGDPFAGVCINIRRRAADTAILLRGQLTRVGVEMWYKVYSPLVEGIEVVQRAAKRARRARLTYMRNVKHDRGSVENVVRMYLRQKAALGTAEGQKKKGLGGAVLHAPRGKKGKGRGKKR
ncbi:translation protein SH3-like domain-containing protein [Massariosphaeria phaeospora]|uniref:Translation protein SH3-like domain-containing protein n=1 Tax=Massariosphaeria phaeospora TaxID=100035 RepID=A0A7C8I5I7_9PLEO|nr:translation protein SH3-like domain-containing protein [Massariosphaeria phaeospora]